MPQDPPRVAAGSHAGQPLRRAGSPLAEARAAMVLLHGRGGSAEDILGLADHFAAPGVALLAPQAAGHTWYPHRFVAPLEANEPHLSSALAAVAAAVAEATVAGIPHEQVVLLGFSQGACLALEYAARHARRYGAVVGLSGGLIGPPDLVRHDPGSLARTAVFLGCSDIDEHIPVDRVHYAAAALRDLGAGVDERIYPGMGHTVNADEIAAVRALLATVLAEPAATR